MISPYLKTIVRQQPPADLGLDFGVGTKLSLRGDFGCLTCEHKGSFWITGNLGKEKGFRLPNGSLRMLRH